MGRYKTIFKFMFAVCLLLCLMTINAYAAEVDRLSGDDRYETAIKISKSGWIKGSSQYAVLATGEDFLDALCAAPLAKKLGAPILLNGPEELDSRVSEELTRLGAKTVYIIGGESAISEKVEDELTKMDIVCYRIFGADKYETTIKIAEHLGIFSEIVIASDTSFPDVLSIAPIAAKKGMPIILTDKNSLSECVIEYLKDKYIDKTYIIGGVDAVSNNIAQQVPNPVRLAGEDRYETNISVLNEFSSELNFLISYVTTGTNYPDALAGSAAAAITSSPIILVGSTPAAITKNYITLNLQKISRIKVLGGEGAVTTATLSELLDIDNGDKYNDYTLRYDADFRVKVSDNVYWVPANSLGKPQYTKQQFSRLIRDPEILRKSINTVYDAVQYIRSADFKGCDDNIYIEENGYKWEHHKPGPKAVITNEGCYASIANLVNYLLKDDYEETGFLHYFQEDGTGYALNYFKQNGKYYIVDFTHYRNDFRYTSAESGDLKNYYNSDYIIGNIHEAASLEEYVAYTRNKFNNPAEIYVAYSTDNILPTAVREINSSISIFFPSDSKESVNIIYDKKNDNMKIEFIECPSRYPSWT